MKERGERPPDTPPKSVLESVRERAGEAPNVMLPESGSGAGASPYVDPRSADPQLLPKGRGNYRILGEIARGGMGVVLKGHDTDLGRDVAMKVLDETLAAKPEVLQRFVEEAQIGGQLQHPGVVPVYELGLTADERPYFTMKLVKGRTLSALLSARRSPDEERPRFLRIFEAVCQTVAYAHSKGVLHRDLKPANVMVGAFGEVQVVDWGLAKVLKRGGVEDEKRASRPTSLTVIETVRSGPGSSGSDSMAGSVMGTPAYMPPEQAQGEVEQLDERSDVFSLGAILCEILTGLPPYVGDDNKEVVPMAAGAKLDDARARIEAAGCAPELKAICLECLRPSRSSRPSNADEVARRVHDHLASVEERAHEARLAAAAAEVRATEERRRRRLAVALAGTVVLLVGAVGGGWAWVRHNAEQRSAEVRRVFEVDVEEAGRLQGEGRFAEALEAALAAQRRVDVRDADDALRARAARMVAGARSKRDEEQARLLREGRNRSFVEGLESLSERQTEVFVGGDLERLEAEYAELFEGYGLDMQAEDLGPALDTMRDSGIPEAFALALDMWTMLMRNRNADPWQVQRLTLIASDLDPHPLGMRMRRARSEDDVGTLLELARPENLRQLPAGTTWTLAGALYKSGRGAESIRVLRFGVGAYPSDYLLNFALAFALQDQRPEEGLLYAVAARSLRPERGQAHTLAGLLLARVGRYPQAVESLRRGFRLDPGSAFARARLGECLCLLGRFEEARDVLAEAFERRPDSVMAGTLLTNARYALHDLDRDDLERAVTHAQRPVELEILTWTALDDPDPGRRSPELALRCIAQLERLNPGLPSLPMMRAEARVQHGEPELALQALESSLAFVPVDFHDQCGLALLRARAWHAAGDARLAREWLEQATAIWDRLTADDPEAWKRSGMARVLAEATQAIGG
jgi:serine/threonine protein kinase/tetratricopeptide (TPR) repeat protein